MTDQLLTISVPKPSRKDIQREARIKKLAEKAKRKIKVQKKAERKLVIKAERVKANKRANSQKKLEKKIQAREKLGSTASVGKRTPISEKKVFVKDEYGIPKN